jgi:hypothetical protein
LTLIKDGIPAPRHHVCHAYIRDCIMAHSYTEILSRSDLNRFLFAEVGVEVSGMTLTVLSALARHGPDPWAQAEQLARLSRPRAANSLAHIIAEIPPRLWPAPAAAEIAQRLIDLLPARGVTVPPIPKFRPTLPAEPRWLHALRQRLPLWTAGALFVAVGFVLLERLVGL